MKKIISPLIAVIIVFSAFFSTGALEERAYFPEKYKKAESIIIKAWEKFEQVADISECGISYEEYDDFSNKLLDRNTEYFYVNTDIQVNYTITDDTSLITSLEFEYLYKIEEIDDRIKRLNDEADKILALIPTGISTEQKLLFLYDYLAAYTDYDIKALDNENENSKPEIRTAYGCLVDRLCVCQGISKAFIFLCEKLGIEAYSVVSDEMCHEWNIVKLGSNYYHIDITYSAPVFTDNRENMFQADGYILHDYFLLSDEQMLQKNHYNWVAPVSATDSKTYENGYWKSVEGMISFFDNNAYFVDNGCLNKIDLTDNKRSVIYSIPDEVFIGADGIRYLWDAYNKETDYESSNSSADYDNRNIYFIVCNSVYLYNVDNGSVCYVYSAENSGYIFSLLYDKKLSLTLKNVDRNSTDNRLYTRLNNINLKTPKHSAFIGDIDGNDEINIGDFLEFAKYLCKIPSPFTEENADVNFDEKINALDYIRLKKIKLCMR